VSSEVQQLVRASAGATSSAVFVENRMGEVMLAQGGTIILHCHSTLSFYTAIEYHSLGIHTVILLPLLSFSVKMTVLPRARRCAGTTS
jgi:hypothetical protein